MAAPAETSRLWNLVQGRQQIDPDYLPDGWEKRTHTLGHFGNLEVRLVDPLDIFIGKLFSKREKDLDDLRALAPQFERAMTEERSRSSGQRMLADAALRANAEKNWWIVFGESFPCD